MPPEFNVCVPEPLNVTVPEPGVNVPELDQLPLSVINALPEAVTVPPLAMLNPAVVQPVPEDAPMLTVPLVIVEVPETERF